MIFISPKEVAESLGVSVATVYELCVARKLGHMRIGSGRGVISIRLQDLEEYLQGAVVPATEEAARPVLAVPIGCEPAAGPSP